MFPLVVFYFALVIGVELKVSHFQQLLLRPRIPILGSIVHTVTFPLVAVALVSIILFFEIKMSESLLLGILLVAACPSGGFSNMLVLLARADLALSVLLTAVSSVFSFLTVPFFFWLFGRLVPGMSGDVNLPVGQTLLSLLVMVVIPIGAGMLWRATCEEYVVPRTKRLQNSAQMLLYLVLVVMLVLDWDVVMNGVGQALPWSLGLCLATLSVGYGFSRLVGLGPVDSVTVAIESSIRNLAVAFLIATSVLGRIDIAVLPGVYFMAVLIVGLTLARFWRVKMAPRYRSNIQEN